MEKVEGTRGGAVERSEAPLYGETLFTASERIGSILVEA
jgi:hypothetical protein